MGAGERAFTAHGAFLNSLVRGLAGSKRHDAVHVYAGQMDLVRGEFADIEQVLDFRNADPTRHCRQRIEVAGRGVEHQVAVPVAFPRPDQGEIGDDRSFQDELAFLLINAEAAGFLSWRGHDDLPARAVAPWEAALGDLGPHAGGRVERGNPATARAQALSQGALRGELYFKLPGQVLAGELLVLPDIGGDDPADTALMQQQPQPPVVDAA